MRGPRDVFEGQRFRRSAGGDLWEVYAIRKDMAGTRHAQLRRVDDPKTLKTLAISVLFDRSQFESTDGS
jgi:hypothetical protein